MENISSQVILYTCQKLSWDVFMAELMKDSLGLVAIEKMASQIKHAWPEFDSQRFVVDGFEGIEALELKARVNHLIEILHQRLPDDFDQAGDVLIAVGENWGVGNGLSDFSGFAIWPLIDYVGVHGLDCPEKSLDVLEVLTPLFSAEFAIRPFINQHFELTYKRLQLWCTHDNEHVRRLASEGIRPRLPWGLQLKQFIKDPADVMDLLDRLKGDEAEYVRRSVANNLNDISKDHPQLVIDICKKWQAETKPAGLKDITWVVRHATRGLVKQGFPPVFSLLGFSEQINTKIENLSLTNAHIKMGENLEFGFDLKAETDQKIVLDYAIHFMKSNGKLAPKVFKLKNIELAAGQTLSILKKQMFKPISTRKYYAGEHRLEILLNGQSFAIIHFILEV